jgi:dihydroflavonol-4-reductase
MSKVLVTGANSFLGSNVIPELLDRGYEVRGMLRKPAVLSAGHKNLEEFNGHITAEKDVIRATEGCDIIIHVAAATDPSAGYREYESVNVGGTENVIKAARFHNIAKLIFVSTANTFGYGTRERPGNETMPAKPPFTSSGYARSKIKAQKLVLEAFKTSHTRVTVVNPTFMIGPRDNKISSNRIILRALDKRMVLIPPGGKNFIHVRDAAIGTCNAIEFGKDGECYILANENLTYKEFYRKMAAVTGKKTLLVRIHRQLLWMVGVAGSVIGLTGLDTAINPVNMKIISTCNFYQATKAIRDLNLPQTPVDKAIKEAISWFNRKGALLPYQD